MSLSSAPSLVSVVGRTPHVHIGLAQLPSRSSTSKPVVSHRLRLGLHIVRSAKICLSCSVQHCSEIDQQSLHQPRSLLLVVIMSLFYPQSIKIHRDCIEDSQNSQNDGGGGNKASQHPHPNTVYHCLYGYYRLGYTRTELARIYSKSERTISNWIRVYETKVLMSEPTR